MALGVRELSKRLGSVRLKLRVKTVFLLTKAHDEGLIGYTREVVEWLLSKDRVTPYIVYVLGGNTKSRIRLMSSRYVEDTLENNNLFDAKSILGKDISREGRLKYWNNELCKRHPLTFDFVVTVIFNALPSSYLADTTTAWWRWYTSLRQLVIPTHRTTCTFLCSRLSRLPHQI